jgi:hypothetical protein
VNDVHPNSPLPIGEIPIGVLQAMKARRSGRLVFVNPARPRIGGLVETRRPELR